MKLRISLYIVAAVLMAAHFYRAGSFWIVALCVAAPLLFLHRKRWSLFVLQLAAYCASVTWLLAALELVQFRQQIGRSWTTAVIILVSVAALTLLSGLLLNSRCMREQYRS
jgi:hypothetical protein